jgi:hypothetical protein
MSVGRIILAVVWALICLAMVVFGVLCVIHGVGAEQRIGGSIICFLVAAGCSVFTIYDVRKFLKSRQK